MIETTSTPPVFLSALNPDTPLNHGVNYLSADGKHYLLFQEDGNLTIRDVVNSSVDVWGLHQVFRSSNGAINNRCQRGKSAKFEANGALVVRDNEGEVVWSSPPAGTAATLDIEASGRMVLCDGGAAIVWASNGWRAYRQICEKQITILGSRATTNENLEAVTKVYAEIMRRLNLDKSKLKDFSIYMVNGEDWNTELASLSPINGHDWDGNPLPNTVGDQAILRGGQCGEFCWMDENLICQKGPDDQYRSYDQVIHEFAHAIDWHCQLTDGTKISTVWRNSVNPADTSRCGFPWGVQHWFGAPAGDLTPAMTTFLEKVFDGRTTFACGTGQPTE